MNMLYLMVVVLFSPLPFLSPFSSAEAISNDVAYGPNFDHIHILNPQSYPIVGDQWKINFETGLHCYTDYNTAPVSPINCANVRSLFSKNVPFTPRIVSVFGCNPVSKFIFH